VGEPTFGEGAFRALCGAGKELEGVGFTELDAERPGLVASSAAVKGALGRNWSPYPVRTPSLASLFMGTYHILSRS
jgi:hypothetical protein